jgi:hypothetical protein
MTPQAYNPAMQQIRHIIGLLLLAPGLMAAQQSPAPAAPAAAQTPMVAPPGLAPDIEEKKGMAMSFWRATLTRSAGSKRSSPIAALRRSSRAIVLSSD